MSAKLQGREPAKALELEDASFVPRAEPVRPHTRSSPCLPRGNMVPPVRVLSGCSLHLAASPDQPRATGPQKPLLFPGDGGGNGGGG